jgi:hypothetical protein
MSVVTIDGQVFGRQQQLEAIRRAVAAASRLILKDFQIKASGGTGASGVKWPRLSFSGRHTRAVRGSAGVSNIRSRKALTERERRLLAPYRGTGRLPLGSDAYNTRRRRQIIGHEVCNTSEYRAIKAERATLRAGMRALEDRAGSEPVGVVSRTLIESFRIGGRACRVDVTQLSATLSSEVSYASAFDTKRTIVPSLVPRDWQTEISEEYFNGIQATSG